MMVGQHLRNLQKEYEAAKLRLSILEEGVRGVEELRAYAQRNQINFDILRSRMAAGKKFAEQEPDVRLQQELLRIRNQEETVLYLIEAVIDQQRLDPVIPQEWVTWIKSFISPAPLTDNPTPSLSNAPFLAPLDSDDLF